MVRYMIEGSLKIHIDFFDNQLSMSHWDGTKDKTRLK